jgi:hypothetical protein
MATLTTPAAVPFLRERLPQARTHPVTSLTGVMSRSNPTAKRGESQGIPAISAR